MKKKKKSTRKNPASGLATGLKLFPSEQAKQALLGLFFAVDLGRCPACKAFVSAHI